MQGNFFGGAFFGGGFFGAIANGVRFAKAKRQDRGKFKVRLADVQDRESTAEFLKAQLRTRMPEPAQEPQIAKPLPARLKVKANPAQVAERKAKEKRAEVARYNATILLMLLNA